MDIKLDNIAEHLVKFDGDQLQILKENIKTFVALPIAYTEQQQGLFMTANINDSLQSGVITQAFINECIDKHFSLDFGDTSKNDCLVNVEAFLDKDRIMSFYKLNPNLKDFNEDERLIIETTTDWEYTMVSFLSKY
jgi:hypothetical protein